MNIIISLGGRNDPEGTLSEETVSRLQTAYQAYQHQTETNKNWKIMVTGGFGTHFNTTQLPHHVYARRYLVDIGCPNDDIISEVESSNT
eukprot:Ihof_evm22s40 gene=Ihof_evmTU22s40